MDKKMKWPEYLMFLRHDTSEFNAMKKTKEASELYKSFVSAYEKNSSSDEARTLANAVFEKFCLKDGDAQTKLADAEGKQAYRTGLALSKKSEKPDIIFVSPYLRTKETLRHLTRGWRDLEGVRVIEDERLREQDHGLAGLYNDWRIFYVLHPEQKLLYEKEGQYYYRYTNGESVPDVRERNRSWIATLIRDFSEKKVLVVSHHLALLSLRANLERLDAKEFIRLDQEEKPINCGVTLYRGNPDKGVNGKFELVFYNQKYY